jgi:predicted DNA-binding WGR domain protein
MAPDTDNPTLLQVLVLERVDRAKNMARFYVLSIEPTLFEDLARDRLPDEEISHEERGAAPGAEVQRRTARRTGKHL